MIKKLRRKLTAVSMLSLLLVLAIIMGAVNILNYRDIVSNADNILGVLADNDGTFPKKNIMDEAVKDKDFHMQMSPELPYESRFFSVLMDDTGRVISVDTGMIAAVDTTTAIEFAEKVYGSEKSKGFVGDYRFVSHTDGDETRIIFLDCGRSLSTFYTFLLTSCSISAFGLAAVFLLMLLISGKIIKPISESYEKQKQFITDAGHEIKTPITIINADAEVLEMELGDNEWLSDIKAQAKRLGALTKDLIYLSRMEEQSKIQAIEFPISDIVTETAQSFQAIAKTQNKSIEVEIQPMLSFCGDEAAMRQLISILLDNALKYSTDNGSIRLSLERQGKVLVLSVENTVDSMSEENIEHMFDRFYRGDQSHSSQTGGYGIGLSIAKAVVTAHKGKITPRLCGEKYLIITATLPMQGTQNI